MVSYVSILYTKESRGRIEQMAFYEWSDKLSVNIASIDRQHQVLIKIINELYDAIEAGTAAGISYATIRKLRNYTRVHFIYEELIFKRLGYSETNEHIEEHQKLISGVEHLCEKIKHNKAISPDRLLEFLKKWLNQHILIEDMAYSKFLISKGIK